MKRETWFVWLTEFGGETLLGLPPSNSGQRRFRVTGVHEGEGPNGIGIWIRVNQVWEINLANNTTSRAWEVSPPLCLILWSHVAYVSKGDETGGIGFTQTQPR